MKRSLIVVSLIVVIMGMIGIPAWLGAQAADRGQPQPGQGQPPQEAIDACSGKNAGDTCEMTSPRGDKIAGTCEKVSDQLACKPKDQPNGGPQGKPPKTPPKEAIEACTGKSAGAACEFTSPRGDKLTGTCAKKDDQLACLPKDRPNQ